MSELVVTDLHASVGDREILKGVNLTIKPGEVHAVMGPNGSGKSTLSHVLMGRPGYDKISGSIMLDGQELVGLPTWQRAQAGLFLAMQYPIEIPGVSLVDVLQQSRAFAGISAQGAVERGSLETMIRDEATSINFDEDLWSRSLNVDLSGGEKKRNETLQLAVLKPRYAVLDELDSGLDVDALVDVSRRVMRAAKEPVAGAPALGVLAITHYSRLLRELKPDVVHVFVAGQIVTSGGPQLVDQLEADGYAAFS
jgi:Fe-S cluster assembly ATP-binding protein